MAGYMIKRYPIENCDQCHDLLMIEKLPEPSSVSQYELLRFKTEKLTVLYIQVTLKFPLAILLLHPPVCNSIN